MSEFEKLKAYYNKGYWSKGALTNAVLRERITEAEYETITGDTFDASLGDPDSVIAEYILAAKIMMGEEE